MEYRVLILSGDELFAEMLRIEFSMLGVPTKRSDVYEEGSSAQVVIIDLDTAQFPPEGSYEKLIGFTKDQALYSSDRWRLCSMILHRPFEMRHLRREVLGSLKVNDSIPVLEPPRANKITPPKMREGEDKLYYDDREIDLTPAEGRIMRTLLQNKGQAVSAAQLSETIGENGEGALAVYICYLRRKTDTPEGLHLIRTVRGKGYKID